MIRGPVPPTPPQAAAALGVAGTGCAALGVLWTPGAYALATACVVGALVCASAAGWLRGSREQVHIEMRSVAGMVVDEDSWWCRGCGWTAVVTLESEALCTTCGRSDTADESLTPCRGCLRAGKPEPSPVFAPMRGAPGTVVPECARCRGEVGAGDPFDGRRS